MTTTPAHPSDPLPAETLRAIREQFTEARAAWRRGFTASLPIATFLEAMLGEDNPTVLRLVDELERLRAEKE